LTVSTAAPLWIRRCLGRPQSTEAFTDWMGEEFQQMSEAYG
jgi:hypothetical protein